MAQAQVTEAREGPAAALGYLRQLQADLDARPGTYSATPLSRPGWFAPHSRPGTASWPRMSPASPGRSRTPTRDSRHWPRAPRTARGWPTVIRPAWAKAATQHPNPWARASAAEDLGVLHGLGGLGGQGDKDRAIHHLKKALDGYRQVGADRDQARIRQRLRRSASAAATGPPPLRGPSPDGPA